MSATGADPQRPFAGERILVTGGAGLIGSTIIDQLLPHGPREIVVFDDFSRGRLANLASALGSDRVTVVEGDVRDPQAVARAMAGIDVVYHQAAIRITRCAEEPRLALEVLADGTFNVVEAAAAEGVRRVVAASSASVYGQAEVLPTAEDHHPWDNETLYGAAKQFNEGVLRSFRQTHGLNYVALRYFNVYGPRMDIHGVYTEVLVRWMERIEAGEPPLILGDGSQTMDFVHVADVARANVLAGATAVEGEVFNVGRGESTSLAELASMLTKVMGAEHLTPVHGPERATNAVHSRKADVTKARDLLGFVAEVDLEAGLSDLVDWWRTSRAEDLLAMADTTIAVGRPVTVPVMRPWLGPEEIEAVTAVLESGWIAQGPKVREFEAALAAEVQTAEGVAVSNATAGLHLSMHLLGLGPDDEVIVPSLSFIATANSVLQTGARPVFADVDEATQNLTAKTIEERLSSRTAAVMVVDQAGVPADLTAIRELCDPLGIPIVEDAACGLGSTRNGRPVGSDADLAVFSFHPRKVITTGEGGMVVTSRPDWAVRLRQLREHGMNHSAFDRHATDGPVLEAYLEPGFNYRMTDLQAAVGLVQLGRLDQMIAERRAGARRYHDRLVELPGIQLVTDPSYGTTNYQSYWIVLPDDFPVSRDEVLARLERAGVSARRGIMAAHLEPAYADRVVPELPVTERLTRQSLILPLFHGITEADQDLVVSVLADAAGTAP